MPPAPASGALLAEGLVLPASALRTGADVRAGPVATDGWPLPDGLGSLLPEGVLRRGSTLTVSRSTSLLLALVGEASRAGAWVAAVGMPRLGVLAAAGAGVDLDRFAMVPAPGESWSTAAAALLDAIDLVVVAPPRRPPGVLTRRLSARARERRAVLLVADPDLAGTSGARWDGADADLTVTGGSWDGVGAGHGHLRAHALDVQASGRRVGGRPRHARLVLDPPSDGFARSVAGSRSASGSTSGHEPCKPSKGRAS